jgi:hypothetical protein
MHATRGKAARFRAVNLSINRDLTWSGARLHMTFLRSSRPLRLFRTHVDIGPDSDRPADRDDGPSKSERLDHCFCSPMRNITESHESTPAQLTASRANVVMPSLVILEIGIAGILS